MLAIDGPCCFYIHNAADQARQRPWSIPQRRLTHYLLVCSFDGEEELSLGAQRYHVRRRDAYLIPPQVLADIGSAKGNRPAWIHFDVLFNPERAQTPHVNAYASALAQRERFLQPGPRAFWGVDLPILVPPQLRALFAEAIPRIIALHQQQSPLAILESRHQLADLMLTWVGSELRRQEPASAPDLPSRIASAEKLARQSLARGFNVEDFAAAVHLSRSRFSVLYHQLRGITPGQFLRNERLRLAETLLSRPEIPVTQVGKMVGYPDPTVFGRVFRAEHGLSPRQWRKQRRD